MDAHDSDPTAAIPEPAIERVGSGRASAESTALDGALRAARDAWPGVRLADRDFARHLAERLPPGAGPSAVCTADLFLACACVQGDAAALHYLETAFLARLSRPLARIDPSPSFFDEVVQRLRRKLLLPDHKLGPRLLEYGGRGPLGGWLRAAAVRIALNLREASWREQGLDSDIERDLVASAADPERTLLKSQLRSHFQNAFGHALGSLSPEERNLLRLHLVEGLSIDRLAVMFQIHRSTAARRIQRLRELLRSRFQLQLAESAGLASKELDSALRAVRSSMDASLSRFFAAEADVPRSSPIRPSEAKQNRLPCRPR